MKKTLLTVVFVVAAAAAAQANELGIGYNYGGPSLRFKWDDSITSELALNLNYTNDAADTKARTEITIIAAPINLALYRGELGQASIGFVFKDRIIYEAGKGLDKSTAFTANDYELDLLLPEIELNFPGVDGLKLIGSIGVGASWGYDDYSKKLESFDMNIFGISMANVGIIYYFDLGTAQKPAVTVPAEEKPAEAKPAEVKPAEVKPAAVKPAEVKPVETKTAQPAATEGAK